jgi:ATP-binding cassette, subfamily B, bacterial
MRERLERRRAFWLLLWRALGWRLPAVGALAVAEGLMPVAAVLASGIMVSGISQAVDGGSRSPGAQHALLGLGLFGAALLVGAGLNALLGYLAQVLDGRYGGAVHRTVARATLGTTGIAALEEPGVAGRIEALAGFERDDGFVATVASLRQLVVQRSAGAGAAVVLFAFAWWAPLVMLAGWRGLSYGIRRWLEHGMEVTSAVASGPQRRSRYLRSLVLEPGTAKESRVFGLADWLVRGYAQSYQEALDVIWGERRLGRRTMLLATSGVLAAHTLVLGALAWRASGGALSAAQLAVFAQAVLGSSALGYVFGAQVPLARATEVAWQATQLARELAGPAAARPAPHASLTGRREQQAGPVDVLLRGVRFSYPGRAAPTLDGLELVIPAGQSLAIVGENGAGKSTLIKLLCGLYEPDLGLIELAGTGPPGARDRIGVIFQNFVRYELPLRANVGFGDLAGRGDEAALARALADAGAGELPRDLPDGWDTVLASGYPGGRDLSGGQWQKIALARALAAVHGGAGLLILDEPTASLDVRAEAELFDRFLEVTAGITTILVSHRLASVRRADRIVVLAGGRVAEDGSHQELMAAGGRYAAMFALQAERFADRPPAVDTGRR